MPNIKCLTGCMLLFSTITLASIATAADDEAPDTPIVYIARDGLYPDAIGFTEAGDAALFGHVMTPIENCDKDNICLQSMLFSIFIPRKIRHGYRWKFGGYSYAVEEVKSTAQGLVAEISAQSETTTPNPVKMTVEYSEARGIIVFSVVLATQSRVIARKFELQSPMGLSAGKTVVQ